MKLLISLIFAALLIACSGGTASTPSPGATRTARPTPTFAPPVPLSAPPEGVLLLTEGRQGAPGWLVDAEGRIERVEGAPFGTSPDGGAVVTLLQTRTGSITGLGVVTADGFELIDEWPATTAYPSALWSPDGRFLAYTTTQPGIQLWDGRESRTLTPEANVWPAAWTEDGSLIVSCEGAGIDVLDAQGDVQQSISLNVEHQAMGWSFSPRGSQIAVQTGWVEDKAGTSYIHYAGLWLYDLPSASWERLADLGPAAVRSGPALFVSADAYAAVAMRRKGPPPTTWSPDGTRLSYYKTYTDDANTYHADLWLHDLATGENRELAQDGAHQAEWSPDGRYLAFIVEPRTLRLLSPDGSIRELDLGYEQSVGWAPDGTLVVAVAAGVTLYDPATGETREVLVGKGDYISGSNFYVPGAAWSPSGRYVAFMSAATWVLDVETARLTKIADDTHFYVAAWLSETP